MALDRYRVVIGSDNEVIVVEKLRTLPRTACKRCGRRISIWDVIEESFGILQHVICTPLEATDG